MSEQLNRVPSFTQKQRYAIAVLGVLATGVLQLALAPILMDDLPFLFFIFPILLASWLGGVGPGLLATALSLLLGGYLFPRPGERLFNAPSR